MVNERITESIVRKHFDAFESELVLEEQRSANPRINNLLRKASKRGTGERGYPEFIIRANQEPSLLVVVECKADTTDHEDPDGILGSDPERYAVDGALLYASYLSAQFDVLAIAVSGSAPHNLRVSHYFHFKEGHAPSVAFGNALLPLEDYLAGYYGSEEKYRQDYAALLVFAKELNQRLHTNKISESDRAMLISAILIALDNKAFRESYRLEDPARLPQRLVDTVSDQIRNAGIQDSRLGVLEQKFGFLTTETVLTTKPGELVEIIDQVDNEVNSFVKTHKYRDVLSGLYVEFLQYANADKGLGIVLTPPHITELFAELAQVNHNSTVYDNCAGTGGFLIASMRHMIESANGDQAIENNIKESQLFGVEVQSSIYPLAVSNMYINQDGKSNISLGDCFDDKVMADIKARKPNVGLLNPPYKVDKRNDIEELEFILNNLNCLQQNGVCVALAPMQAALATRGKIRDLKREILKSHTLEAVLSLPDELFFNSDVAVVTCAMIFTAHRPHPNNKQTFLGYFKDDGFVKRKVGGRNDADRKWAGIKNTWVETYINRVAKPGLSVNVQVDAKDEWAAECYMETDYSRLTPKMFVETLQKYSTYLFANFVKKQVNSLPYSQGSMELDTSAWKQFDLASLFKVSGSKTTPLRELEEAGAGMYPYVTTQAANNGVAGFYNHSTEQSGGAITVDSAVVGYCSYQDGPFSASDHVEILTPTSLMNAYVAMFLVTVLNMEQYRYNYGRKCSQTRLRQSKIKLPVSPSGDVDYEFMEQYIKTLPYSANLSAVGAHNAEA